MDSEEPIVELKTVKRIKAKFKKPTPLVFTDCSDREETTIDNTLKEK